MKVVKIIFGALAGIYAIAQLFQLFNLITQGVGHEIQAPADSGRAIGYYIGTIAGLLFGGIISLALFRSAFKTDDEEFEYEEDCDIEEFYQEEYEFEERGGNYITKHWYGELSLNMSFWVNLVVVYVSVIVLFKLSATILSGGSPVTAGRVYVIIIPIFYFVLYPWQIVGLWRCCNRHKITTGSSRCGRLVQGLIIIGLLVTLVQLKFLFPIYRDCSIIGFTKDSLGEAKLALKKDNTIIHLEGMFGFGVSRRVEKLLKKYPEIDSIILDSGGGRIYEGRQLGKLITKYKLDTYSLTECCSAASIAFISGQRRFLGASAVMGYHQYKMGFASMEPYTDMAKEQTADLGLFRSKGVKEDFLGKLFNASHDDLWFPSHEEMLEAGVIDGVVNPVDLLGDEYEPDLSGFEQGLLENKLFEVIKKYEPESYSQLLKSLTDKYKQGASLQQMQIEAIEAVQQSAIKFLPETSDKGLIQFARNFIYTFNKIKGIDPADGVKFINPKQYGPPDFAKYFTKEEQEAQNATMTVILIDAYEKDNPEPDINAAQLKLASIQLQLRDSAQYMDPSNLENKEDYKKFCESMVKFYELILAEDEKTAANILRSVFAQVE